MKTEAEIKQVIAGMVLSENGRKQLPNWAPEHKAILLKAINALSWVIGWPSTMVDFEKTLKKDIAESPEIAAHINRMLEIVEAMASMGIPIDKEPNETKSAQPPEPTGS